MYMLHICYCCSVVLCVIWLWTTETNKTSKKCSIFGNNLTSLLKFNVKFTFMFPAT